MFFKQLKSLDSSNKLLIKANINLPLPDPPRCATNNKERCKLFTRISHTYGNFVAYQIFVIEILIIGEKKSEIKTLSW